MKKSLKTLLYLLICLNFLLTIVGCSSDDGNVPPRNFEAKLIEEKFNEVYLRWTESTDPENSIVKYRIYVSEDNQNEDFKLVGDEITELEYADKEYISVNGELYRVERLDDSSFRFAYVVTGLNHNSKYKIKIVAYDQDGGATQTTISARTLEDQSSPMIVNFEQKTFRYSNEINYGISDGNSHDFRTQVYLNDVLVNENRNSYEYVFSDLQENTFYGGKIVVSDGNSSSEYEFNFTTDGDVYEGDVKLRFQRDVEKFSSNNYRKIIGQLSIQPMESCCPCRPSPADVDCEDEITSLNLLSSLEEVEGDVRIVLFTTGPEISPGPAIPGLNNLKVITQNLLIKGADPSKMLNNLNTINSDLVIEWMPETEERIFENLSTLNNLNIEYSKEINGFDSITTVSGGLDINNCFLTNLNSFSGLERINGNLIVNNNNIKQYNGNSFDIVDGLRNLDGFSSLTFVEGDLEILRHSSYLTDFCGIRNLLSNNGLMGSYIVENNDFNPTFQNIIEGNCSQ